MKDRRLVQIEDLKASECACHKCVNACRFTPGLFVPGEAEKAAALLGMTLEEFEAKYLIREYQRISNGDEDELVWVYSPRKVGVDTRRKTASFSAAFAPMPCVFLENERCKIHEAKPFECRMTRGCEPYPEIVGVGPLRHWIAQQWKASGQLADTKPEPHSLLDTLEEIIARTEDPATRRRMQDFLETLVKGHAFDPIT